VFTKIINGEIPSHKVYEDDKTLAFLDIRPITPGMTLVVTKSQVANFEDLEDEDYQALWSTVRKVALKLRKTFPDAHKIGVQVEGFEVPHVHVKVLPLFFIEDFKKEAEDPSEPDHTSLAAMAERLKI